MNTLYIIGNGFDLAHGLKTEYTDYRNFLSDKHPEFYSFFCEHFDTDNEFWAEFEKKLATLKPDHILETYQDYAASPSSPDFQDRDWGAYATEVETHVEKLINKLFTTFKEFILNVQYPELKRAIIEFKQDAIFLSFNYTRTLELYYNIPPEKILFIHGNAYASGHDLILGHDFKSDVFLEDSPPPNLTKDELERWEDYMNDKYDFSTELAKQEISKYFELTLKNTDIIIKNNLGFFKNLHTIDEIHIFGHSLSSVDLPYLHQIKASTLDHVIWFI